MAVKDDVASVDILAHAVAESEFDDGLAMEEPARRARRGRHPEQQHLFQFGKYRNERYEDVTEETPDYYFWGSQEREPSKYLQHYLEWVTEHYVVDPVRSTLTSKATGRILEAKPSLTKRSEEDRVAAQEVFAPGRVEASSEMCSPVRPAARNTSWFQCDARTLYVLAVQRCHTRET